MIYLVICILIGVVCAVIQNYYCKNLFHNISDNLMFQLVTHVAGMVCCFVSAGFLLPSGYTTMLGAISGVLVMLESYFILRSMTKGPMSLTSLFSMAALLIPVCLTPVLWHKPLSVSQIVGTVLVLISMALTLDIYGTYKAEREAKAAALDQTEAKSASADAGKASDLSWLPYAIAAFFTGGLTAIPENYLIASAYADEAAHYTSVKYIVVVLLTLLVLVYRRKKLAEHHTMKFSAKLILPMVLIGSSSAVFAILIIEALKYLSTSTVYGGSNGGRLILITVLDVVLFKQKLKPIQIIGIAVGLVALICLSM